MSLQLFRCFKHFPNSIPDVYLLKLLFCFANYMLKTRAGDIFRANEVRFRFVIIFETAIKTTMSVSLAIVPLQKSSPRQYIKVFKSISFHGICINLHNYIIRTFFLISKSSILKYSR